MKFETILDAYFRTIEDVAGERIYDEYIPLRIRQRDAFRARLERMYHGLERDFFNVLITSAGEYEEAEVRDGV